MPAAPPDGDGDDGVEEFCRNAGIPILMRIPLDQRIGKAVARGEALVEAFPEYLPRFQDLYAQIRMLVEPGTGSELQTQSSRNKIGSLQGIRGTE